MPVTKTTRECYEIRNEGPYGEWANITMTDWGRTTPDSRAYRYFGGEIQIHSSFGSWGYRWNSCGVPFKQFLQEIEFGYAFGKFMGTELTEFDSEKSLKGLREKICEHRRYGWLNKAEARGIWEGVTDAEDQLMSSEHDWVEALEYIRRDLCDNKLPEAARFLEEPWEMILKSPKEAPKSFWEQLWPLFIEALKAETSGATKGLQTQPETAPSP